MTIEHKTKLERKLQYQVNGFRKRLIGQERIWKLEHIAVFTDADADLGEYTDESRQAMKKDALFLSRLAWDLQDQHDAVRGRRASLDDQGPRGRGLYAERGPRP